MPGDMLSQAGTSVSLSPSFTVVRSQRKPSICISRGWFETAIPGAAFVRARVAGVVPAEETETAMSANAATTVAYWHSELPRIQTVDVSRY